MAKRSARYKSREALFDEDNVHRLFPSRGGWSPRDAEENRDRKYVKNIRAASATQQVLLTAIDERSVVLAVGPQERPTSPLRRQSKHLRLVAVGALFSPGLPSKQEKAWAFFRVIFRKNLRPIYAHSTTR